MSLFDNAVASLRMGVEDFRQQSPDRNLSSVRNFYSGVLLLAKEALVRSNSRVDPALIIAKRTRLVPDGDGGVKLIAHGGNTIGFDDLAARLKDFNIIVNTKDLASLNKIRNDLEHYYAFQSHSDIRSAISKVFPVAAALFRAMGEEPAKHLGPLWAEMLTVKELYDEELAEAHATLSGVNWHSSSVNGKGFQCTICGSELLRQFDPGNVLQEKVGLYCVSCGVSNCIEEVVSAFVQSLYFSESYYRFKDGGEPGPVFQCPACENVALVEDEYKCAVCGNEFEYNDECALCSASISLSDYLEGIDGGLCSYCTYRAQKDIERD
jgi:DNA-directed RNA polymerase subunit RPC12/RpoP